jgi:hypothetical protein
MTSRSRRTVGLVAALAVAAGLQLAAALPVGAQSPAASAGAPPSAAAQPSVAAQPSAAAAPASAGPVASPAPSNVPAPVASSGPLQPGTAHVLLKGTTNADLTLPFVPSEVFPRADGSYDLQWQDSKLDTLNVTLDLAGGKLNSGFVAVGAPGTSIYDTAYYADFVRSQCLVAVTKLDAALVEGTFTCSQLENADGSGKVDASGQFSAVAPPPSPSPAPSVAATPPAASAAAPAAASPAGSPAPVASPAG